MTKLHDLFSSKSSNQRPLRVGEEIRHALAEIFMRGDSNSRALADFSITVSEVRVSPELKNATAYVMSLGGVRKEEMLAALTEAAPELRYLVSKKVKLRYMPRIQFALDMSFDEAERINKLLRQPEVAQDLQTPADK